MKKSIYISGIVLANMFVIGAMFKMFHWPGAGILLVLGLGLFCLWFLPAAVINSYQGSDKTSKLVYIVGFICAFIDIMGALWKIQHWPGAGVLLIIGIPLPFVLFLPVYIYYQNKEKQKSGSNLIGVMLLFLYIAIFSALLALNVSRDILYSFINTGEEFAVTDDIYKYKTDVAYTELLKPGNTKDSAKVAELRDKSNDLCKSIDNLKIELIISVEGANSEACAGGAIDLKKLKAIDESVITKSILLGTETEDGKASILFKSISAFKEYLTGIAGSDKSRRELICLLLDTSDKADTSFGQNKILTWEEAYFSDVFLVTALGNLSSIQNNIRMAEVEALAYLRN